jgi:flagellar basal body-associated protein FliL
MPRAWKPEEIETAKEELRRRHPEISGATFRVLVATATKEIKPEAGVDALVDCAVRVMKALRGNER